MSNKLSSHNDQNDDTNMILSSNLLKAMIEQVKDGLKRVSELIKEISNVVIVITDNQRIFDSTIQETRKNIENIEKRLTILIKDQSGLIINEIQLNSDQHKFIIKKLEEIDQKSENSLNDKIKLILNEIGGNSDEHGIIINKVTDISSNTMELIKDKNEDILTEFKNTSKKLEELAESMKTIIDKLSIFNNRLFKLFAVVTIVVTIIGLFGGIKGIITSVVHGF